MERSVVEFSLLVLGSLGLAACNNSSTIVTEVNPAVTLRIDPAPCNGIVRCGHCTLNILALDKNSKPARFPTILWTTVPSDLARASGDGYVEAFRAGKVMVTGTVQATGATDQVQLTISERQVPDCSPSGDVIDWTRIDQPRKDWIR